MLTRVKMLTIIKRSLVRIYLFGLCVAIFLCGCAKPGEKALSRGDTLLKQGRFAEAISVFKELTITMPDEARVWNLLGVAYHHTGDLVAAAHSYTTALKLSNNFYIVHYNLGCALFETQNYLQASREFASFVMYNPQSADGWTKLGSSQLFLRQYDLAEKSFRTALSIDPKSYEAYNGLGIALMYKKQIKEAAQCFTNSLKLKPDYAPANLNLGIILLQYQKDRAGAVSMFKRFLILRPNHYYFQTVSNLIYKIENQTQAPQINKIQPVTGSPQPIIDKSSGVPVSNKTAEIHPVETAEVRTITVSPSTTSIKQTNEHKNAVQKIQTPAVQSVKPPSSVPVEQPAPVIEKQISERTNQIVFNQKSSSPTLPVQQPTTEKKEAAEKPVVTQKIEETKPQLDSRGNQSQPVVQPQQKDLQTQPQQKQSILDKLNPFKKKPAQKPIVTPLPPLDKGQNQGGTTLQKIDEKKENIQTNKTVEQVEPKIAPVKVAKVELPPQFPRYNYSHPRKPAEGGDRASAIKQIELGIKAHDGGDLTGAKSRYEEAVKLDPSLFEANYNLALVLYELGDLDRALFYYEKALAINPEAKNARFNFALALQKGNFIYDSAREFENYLNINPQDNRARLLLANMYAQQLKDKTNAARHYLEILKTEPNHPQALVINEWLKQNYFK